MTPDVLAPLLARIATFVAERADELNRLDAVAGDGDLGLTVAASARALTDAAATADTASRGELCRAIGMAIARNAASTSGTLLATAFLRVGDDDATDPVASLATAVRRAAEGMRTRGKAEIGDRTMLDVLFPVADALDASATAGTKLPEALQNAARVAHASAEATADMEAKIGRAGWLRDRAAGSVDAGSRLIDICFEAAAAAIENPA